MFNEIIGALAELEPQGDFSIKTKTTIDDLQLEIGPIGRLQFPITPSVVKKMIKLAKPATFGWRDKTCTDTKVRDCWKIPKSSVKIDKRRWNRTLNPTLEQIKIGLGLPKESRLKAQLHDLVIYAPGQFFGPHQDSEKCDDMVATLVVVLPSTHSGGSLIIDHLGEKKTYHSSRTSLDQLTFFAFYADCYHEVKPVKDGYRIVLTYNLLLSHTKHKTSAFPTSFAQQLTQTLDDYFSPTESTGATENVVYLLDHAYTPKGLSWENLKNADRLRASALIEAANDLDLEIHLGLADVQEIWECEHDGDYSRPSWGRRSYGGIEKKNAKLSYLIDSTTTVKHLLDAKGNALAFPDWYLRNEELCWTKSNDALKPFESHYEGWMGNYGNTLDRWYHRAAIILWRRDERFVALLRIAPNIAFKELLILARKKNMQVQVADYVQQILPHWSGFKFFGSTDKPDYSTLFLLAGLLDPGLAKQLLLPVGLDALSSSTAAAMVGLQKVNTPNWLIEIVQTWFDDSRRRSASVLDHFVPLISAWVKQAPDTHHIFTNWLLSRQLVALMDLQKRKAQTLSFAQMKKMRCDNTINLLKMAALCQDDAIFDSAIDQLIEGKKNYASLTLVQIASELKHSTMPGKARFLEFVCRELIETLKMPERQIDDWSILEKDHCACTDCLELHDFLASGDLQRKIWPLAKARRQHIHLLIDSMEVPVNHKTERSGSPYQLHLEKTEQIFKNEKTERSALEKALKDLEIF